MKKFLCAIALFLVPTSASAWSATVTGTFGPDNIYVGDYWEWTGFSFVNRGVHSYVNGTLTYLGSGGVVGSVSIYGGTNPDYIECINSTDGNLGIFFTDELRPVTSTPTMQFHIRGEGGSDEIYGSDFNDFIAGGASDDTIHGRGGNDRIYGLDMGGFPLGPCSETNCPGTCTEGSVDSCYGEAGNDDIVCDDLADGGTGADNCFSDVEISCSDTDSACDGECGGTC